MPKKPTGDIGPVTATAQSNRIDVSWNTILFPSAKVDQESFITSAFLPALKNQEGLVFAARKLPEADHDFMLESTEYKIDLQLMEIVIRPKRGSPYQQGPRDFIAGKFADYVFAEIKKKLYPKGNTPIWLLLYYTHWRFNPAPPVQYLLHQRFAKNEHPYERIFLLHLLAPGEAAYSGLHPTICGPMQTAILAYPNEAAARAQTWRVADPSAAFSADGMLSLPL